ncbi:MAG: Phosphoserine phosphatase [Promethearchaeota archaeon]|nr:MAG: Phosphoserine phosphatase [Candidatus Lokiarchaeota archaeon]
MKVCCWDLEGPISVVDFAAEMGKLLGSKRELGLQKYDMGEFFFMISQYDDYLIDTPGVKKQLDIPEYQPGDTLRIMAPMFVACFTDKELKALAKNNLGILPGIQELMALIQKEWEIFIISTSYSQFAHQVAKMINISQDHVYCTDLNLSELKKNSSNIEDDVDLLVKTIFQKYLDNDKNLNTIINDLNSFFWKGENSDYIKIMNKVKVRGGKRKERAVEDIADRTKKPISEMIAIGDSITDINMLERLDKEGGIAVSFNGNRFSLKYANSAVTTPNGLGILPLFEHYDHLADFFEKWEEEHIQFADNPKKIPEDLVSKICKNHFIYYDFVPKLMNLSNKTSQELQKIIQEQEKMRKKVRGWAGRLG